MNCNARERGDLCGADDCRTCHPENFDDDGHLLTVCETCGERFSAAFDETVCPDCEERAKELEEDQDDDLLRAEQGETQTTGEKT